MVRSSQTARRRILPARYRRGNLDGGFPVHCSSLKNSIQKVNPVKERTAALAIARERKENFVIPLNLDGLGASELGWMQSDLTYIPFGDWKQGFTQLLKNLETAGAPKSAAPTSVAALLQSAKCVNSAPEILWSNLVPIKRIPSRLYRYEHNVAMTPSNALRAAAAWPYYRENASVCWSFQAPPAELLDEYRFVHRGTCDGWRSASGPDLNFYNIGKKVINSTLFHSLLSAGLRYDADNRYVYVPNEKRFERLTFSTPAGASWIKAVGLRSFWTTQGRDSCSLPSLAGAKCMAGFLRTGRRVCTHSLISHPTRRYAH